LQVCELKQRSYQNGGISQKKNLGKLFFLHLGAKSLSSLDR